MCVHTCISMCTCAHTHIPLPAPLRSWRELTDSRDAILRNIQSIPAWAHFHRPTPSVSERSRGRGSEASQTLGDGDSTAVWLCPGDTLLSQIVLNSTLQSLIFLPSFFFRLFSLNSIIFFLPFSSSSFPKFSRHFRISYTKPHSLHLPMPAYGSGHLALLSHSLCLAKNH